jgi:hypothetical protein
MSMQRGTPGPGGGNSVHIVNDSYLGTTVIDLRMAPIGSSDYGPNQLAEPLLPGGTAEINGVPNGRYDIKNIRVERSDGRTDTVGTQERVAFLFGNETHVWRHAF